MKKRLVQPEMFLPVFNGGKAVKWRLCRLVLLITVSLCLYNGLLYASCETPSAVIKAEELFLEGRFSEALPFFEEVLQQQPENARALSGLGRAHYHINNSDRAESYLRQSLAVDSTPWISCWNRTYLGKVASQRNDFETALVYFDKVISNGSTKNCVRTARSERSFVWLEQYRQQKLLDYISVDCCRVHVDKEHLASDEINRFVEETEAAYEHIAAALVAGSEYRKLDIYVYPQQMLHALWESKEILARELRTELHVYYTDHTDPGYLKHELTHALTAKYVQHQNVSPLLIEGLAEFLAGDPWGKNTGKWIRGFLDADQFISLLELMDGKRFRELNPVITYTEAASFVQFVVDRFGMESCLALIRGEGTLEELFSQSIEQIESMWLESVGDPLLSENERSLFQFRVQLGVDSMSDVCHKKMAPWLGITLQASVNGALVDHVDPKSPAWQQGIRKGDLLHRFAGIDITGDNLWQPAYQIRKKRVDDVVQMLLYRDGIRREISVKLSREFFMMENGI